jgi:PRC-barrel domain
MEKIAGERNFSGWPAEAGRSFEGGTAGSPTLLNDWMSQMASEWAERRTSTNNRRAFMKTTMLAFMIMALLTGFLTTEPVWAEPTGSSTIAGGNSPDDKKIPQDKRVDLIPGQPIGSNEEYTTTPVRQGKLQEVKDSKWLNQPVANPQGEKLGKITKVLRDETTQNIEYVMFQLNDAQAARPLPWSKFQEKGDKLVLNATKEELATSVSSKDSKDMSPDLAMFMEEIEQKRNEPKGGGGGNEAKAGDPGSLSGAATMGEDATGTHRSAPATPAPSFKHEGDKAKKQ